MQRATLALSLAHDVVFGLLGGIVALSLSAGGVRRFGVQAAVFIAMVCAGPLMFLQRPRESGGYSIGNLLSLSFRPHVPLSYLLTVGFATAVLGGVFRARFDARARLFPALIACTAILAITDEITLVLLGLWVGTVWLLDHRFLADSWLRGVLKLALLVLAIGGAIWLFGGSLGPHAERYPMWLVAPRAPGWNYGPEPISRAVGRSRVFEDLFTILGAMLAALVFAIVPKRRETRTLAISFLVLGAAALAGFMCVDFNHQAIESHRWVTLAFLFSSFLLAFVIAQPDPPAAPKRPASLSAMLVYLSCGLGVASTLDWLTSGAGTTLHTPQFAGALAPLPLYDVDCRKLAGARLGEATSPTYAAERGEHIWTGCHPTFVPGPPWNQGGHKIKTGGVRYGSGALSDLYASMLGPAAPLTVSCLKDEVESDPICAAARDKVRSCVDVGTRYTVCTVPSARRDELWSRSPKKRY